MFVVIAINALIAAVVFVAIIALHVRSIHSGSAPARRIRTTQRPFRVVRTRRGLVTSAG